MRVHVDDLTVAIAAGTDPLPESVKVGAVIYLDVSDRVDRDELIDELNVVLRGHPHVLDDRYSDYSWGASGASLDLLVQVAEVIGGVASTGYLIEKVVALARRRGWRIGRTPEESGVRGGWGAWRARKAVAKVIDASERETSLVDMHGTPWGSLVTVDTPFGRFEVEIRQDGVDRITKVSDA
jgi:hypothetical protein